MYPRNVLAYLEKHAYIAPNKLAAEDEHEACCYEDLKNRCQSIGTALTKRIAYGAPVAVVMEKGIPALSAFWGIVYAGGYYVLLNPDLPVPRLKQVQSVLRADYVITDRLHMEIAQGLISRDRILTVEDLTNEPVDAASLQAVRDRMIDTDPLYANFTSGSTGVPKGVVVSHRSVIDFIENFVGLFGFDQKEIFANQAPFDFDVSVKDIYASAKTGGTLVITPKRLFSKPAELLDWLCDHKVTTMIWAVSALCLISMFHGLDYRTPATVKHILFSGEVMPYKHLREWMRRLPDAVYVNLYGPTEITCNCTYHLLDRGRDYSQGIPIGRSFPNEDVFLLDQSNHRIVRPDVEGELCVRGSALALGYLSAPEQTAAAFVQNPLNPHYPETIYRTGDLAKYNAAGELMFCGRRDHQIKYMGHRIELQEIERAMAGIDGVERCCCVFNDKTNRLYGFYMGEIPRQELYSTLRERLPAFMVPGFLYPVSCFPLTKNGKIDRAKLLQGKEIGND